MIANRLLLVTGLLVAAASASCDSAGSDQKLVDDGTPFIVSTLEVSPDTVIHYPQVFVGALFDSQDPRYDFIRDPEREVGNELFQPDLWAQVVLKAAFTGLRVEPDPDAEVTLTGPLGMVSEQTVVLAYEGGGAYGDVEGALPLETSARYRLDVRLADGRTYTAETHTPAPYAASLPDTFSLPVEYRYYGPGDWAELSQEDSFERTPSSDTGAPITTYRFNRHSNLDREVSRLGPEERFIFHDRGEHLRDGARYFISTHGEYNDYDLCKVVWATDARTSRWDRSPIYIRISQLTQELARAFEAPYPYIGMRKKEGVPLWDDPWDAVADERQTARLERDRTYFPRISNIQPVDGTSTEAPDAVGVFGGLTARYFTRVIEPVRSFDPDTLTWAPPWNHPDP